MNLQDLSLEQLKEIIDGAPRQAVVWNDHKKRYQFFSGTDCYAFLSGSRWEKVGFAGEPLDSLIPLLDIRAELLARQFKVGDRVVCEPSKQIWLIKNIVDVITIIVESKRNGVLRVKTTVNKTRHATAEEIAAGHRIDAISNEMASPCAVSDSAKNQAEMDLRGNKTDSITERLNPAKCGKVNPALAYDELGFDDMTIAHRSPACKCDADVSQPAPMVDGELHAPIGQKHDQGKPRYSLIPSSALEAIVDVLEYGATKYAPDGWKHVENARERYYNASMRHIQSWWSGERLDPETGLPHLAHAVCSLMFLMWLDGEQGE